MTTLILAAASGLILAALLVSLLPRTTQSFHDVPAEATSSGKKIETRT
jgi:hypothetical protein